jgi:hypothetical protein
VNSEQVCPALTSHSQFYNTKFSISKYIAELGDLAIVSAIADIVHRKFDEARIPEATGFDNSTEFSNCQLTKKHLCKSCQKQQITARARICKRLRSPGIDSKESIPLAYVALRAGMITMFVVLERQAT